MAALSPSFRATVIAVSFLTATVLWAGCGTPTPFGVPASVPLIQPGALAQKQDLAGIENAFQLGPRLWSGGEPHGDVAFAALAAVGVRTVVSVDGARPDVDAARRHGLRYVHVPIGYDGVPSRAVASLAALSKTKDGGLFVHCHHGRHRGPSAAALIARAAGAWDPAQAEAWQKLAGTSADYPGLYRSVRDFQMPSDAAVESAGRNQKSAVKPAGLVESMVIVDGQTEALADMKRVGWKPTPALPDETPVQAARLLHEQFREGVRLGLGPKDPAFVQAMKAGESSSFALESALRSGDRVAADAAWKQIKDGCVACHQRWRNDR